MGANLLHGFQCTISESGSGGGTGIVGPNEWNADHQLYLDLNAQTGTTYTIAAADAGALITFSNASAVAVSLPQAQSGAATIGNALGFYKGWFCIAQNIGAGAVTITGATSTINGSATLVLTQGQWAIIVSDGTNYRATISRGTSIVGISGGGTGVGSVTVSPTPSAWAGWDANSNLSANNLIDGFTTTATAAGTTTLTVGSAGIQAFTGSTTQTVKLPTTSIVAGASYLIINSSTGAVTVQSSGANTIVVLAPGAWGTFIAQVATPTTAANWNFYYYGALIASGKELVVSNSLTLAGTDATTMTFPASSASIAALNLTSQTFSGGLHVTSFSLSTGSVTIDCGNGPQQYITASTSAWVITAPSSDGNCILKVSIGTTGNVPTFSGFTVGSNIGDTMAVPGSGTNIYMISILRINSTSTYIVKACQ